MRLLPAWLGLGISLASMAVSAAPVAWGESASVKLRPQHRAPDSRPEQEVALFAAKNETVAFQVGVEGGETGLTGLGASLASLRGAQGNIDRSAITLYRQSYLDIQTSSGGFGEKGFWPDGLIPDANELSGAPGEAFPMEVPPGQTRGIWVDVHVPSHTPAGVYRGQVQLEAPGYSHRIPVSLTVVEATFSSTPTMASSFLLWPPHLCHAHTGTPDCGGDLALQERLVADYQRLALAHRLTLSNTLTAPANHDWSHFDAQYGPFLNGTRAGPLEGARMTSAQYMGPREDATMAEQVRHFAQRGWLDRLYDYTGDEPPHGISFGEVASRAAQVERAAPELTTLLTTSIGALREHQLEGSIDRLVALVNFLQDDPQPYQDFAQRPGKSLWLYQSCMSHGCEYGSNVPENRGEQGWPSYMVDRSAAKNRAMQWLVFLAGAKGELYYQTVGMLGSAWTDQFRFNGNGDGTLFYPGPLPSIRLKLIRQGIQDFEWLTKVSEAGDPQYAQLIARSVIPSPHRVGDDGLMFDEARKALIVRYLELKGQTLPQWEEPQPPSPQSADPVPPDELRAEEEDPSPAGGCSSAGTWSLASLLLVALWWSRRP